MKERGIVIVGHMDSGVTTCIERIEAKASHKVTVIEPEKVGSVMQIKNYHAPLNIFTPPLTRAQRRKLNRKK